MYLLFLLVINNYKIKLDKIKKNRNYKWKINYRNRNRKNKIGI